MVSFLFENSEIAREFARILDDDWDGCNAIKFRRNSKKLDSQSFERGLAYLKNLGKNWYCEGDTCDIYSKKEITNSRILDFIYPRYKDYSVSSYQADRANELYYSPPIDIGKILVEKKIISVPEEKETYSGTLELAKIFHQELQGIIEKKIRAKRTNVNTSILPDEISNQEEKIIAKGLILGAKMSLEALTIKELAKMCLLIEAGMSCLETEGFDKVSDLFDSEGFCRNPFIIQAFHNCLNERI